MDPDQQLLQHSHYLFIYFFTVYAPHYSLCYPFAKFWMSIILSGVYPKNKASYFKIIYQYSRLQHCRPRCSPGCGKATASDYDNLSFWLYNAGITSFLKGGHDEMVYNTAQACLTYPAFSASERDLTSAAINIVTAIMTTLSQTKSTSKGCLKSVGKLCCMCVVSCSIDWWRRGDVFHQILSVPEVGTAPEPTSERVPALND